MNTPTTTAQEATMTVNITPDLGDELAAGRSYPVRKAGVRMSHAVASALLVDIHNFWLDAAAGYTRLVEAGCADSAWDARQALAAADHFAPR